MPNHSSVEKKPVKDPVKNRGLGLSNKEYADLDILQPKIGAKSKIDVIRLGIRCLKDRVGVRTSVDAGMQGLVTIIEPANGYHYEKVLQRAKHLTLVFNDARSWLDGPIEDDKKLMLHIEALGARAKDKAKTTTVYLHHPLNPHMQSIAEVSGKPYQVQVGEIYLAVEKLKNFVSPRFRVLGHPRYNTYSMVMADKDIYVNYYPVAFRGKDDTGHIHHYRKTKNRNGVFSRLSKDIEQILRAAEDMKLRGTEYDLSKFCRDNPAPR